MQQCAQVLLTLDNLADRNQYLNASNTFQELFQMGTIPIVNENDTVAVQQLRFGDNDTLSAEVRVWKHLMHTTPFAADCASAMFLSTATTPSWRSSMIFH